MVRPRRKSFCAAVERISELAAWSQTVNKNERNVSRKQTKSQNDLPTVTVQLEKMDIDKVRKDLKTNKSQRGLPPRRLRVPIPRPKRIMARRNAVNYDRIHLNSSDATSAPSSKASSSWKAPSASTTSSSSSASTLSRLWPKFQQSHNQPNTDDSSNQMQVDDSSTFESNNTVKSHGSTSPRFNKSKSMSISSQEAQSIISRSCRVNVYRMDVSQYRNSGKLQKQIPNTSQQPTSMKQNDPLGPNNNGNDDDNDDATFYESVSTLSSIKSLSKIDGRRWTVDELLEYGEQVRKTQANKTSSSILVSTSTPKRIHRRTLKDSGDSGLPPGFDSTNYPFGDVDEDDKSTHCDLDSDGSSEISDQNKSQPFIQINNEQFLISQTSNYIPLDNIGRSVSVTGNSFISQNESDLDDNRYHMPIEPKKYFVDSSCVSYGAFIKYKTETFAVNYLGHDNKTIRRHFLSKFSRDHLHTLSTNFNDLLYVSDVTGTHNMVTNILFFHFYI